MTADDATLTVGAQLEKNWDSVQEKTDRIAKESKESPNGSTLLDIKEVFIIWKILIRTFGWTYAFGTILQLAHSLMQFAEPLLLK